MNAMLNGKKITVGVTGGIAAYKAADIVSWLTQQGALVQVAMTEAATKLISPLTLKTLSGRPVALDIFSQSGDFQVPHIDLADCDLLLLLPATANILAKASHGLADDLLSATLLATTAPILAAPAMNTKMYQNPATQENIATLQKRGWQMIEPGYGRLACGALGQGRLADLPVIKEAIQGMFGATGAFSGKHVLVTAGPTYEYIDPVRFIGNRSSGKMGYALAEAARNAGATVTLVLGPSALPDLPGATTLRVTTAAEMYDAVWQCYEAQDIVIMAAAVSDYRVQEQAAQKLKKEADCTLQLVQNPDILLSLGQHKAGRFLVGFAAETNDLTSYAAQKLKQKNLDLIIANDVSAAGAGFDVDTNIITAIYPEEAELCVETWPLLSKKVAAQRIMELIYALQQSL